VGREGQDHRSRGNKNKEKKGGGGQRGKGEKRERPQRHTDVVSHCQYLIYLWLSMATLYFFWLVLAKLCVSACSGQTFCIAITIVDLPLTITA
jgi:hypothetical protein